MQAIPAATASARQRTLGGFTLIETLIVLAIAALLSCIAYPAFEAQVLKARRVDALLSLMQAQLAQERWRANSTRYGSLTDIGMPGVSSAGHYTLRVTANTADAYRMVAIATGVQSRDGACRHLQLSASGANLVYASGPDASAANPAAANRQCWSL